MNRGEYFLYLTEKISNGKERQRMLLLSYLFDTKFIWSYKIPTDANRAKDGQLLRDRYANETGDYILYNDKIEPCNVLEMLVALSIRIEEDIMAEPGDENPSRWFWEMIKNLDLNHMTDKSFSEKKAGSILFSWMNRLYDSEGNGGLFPLKKAKKDQRLMSIWDQMNLYLNEQLKGESLC